MSTNALNVLYLAHDLADAAVHRRVEMLRDGGAAVTVAGFRRTNTPIESVAGCAALNLGQTHNGKFGRRALTVLREVARCKARTLPAPPDLIMARNLEMLAIAVRLRSQYPQLPAVVYESLDIHRLMLNSGPVGFAFRGLEGFLSRRADALITSSPAFVDAYFHRLSKIRLPIRLVENKVYDSRSEQAETQQQSPRALVSPWKIGWFGVIRCRKSLQLLADLVTSSGGGVEVTIRGRPMLDQIPDFHKIVAATPGIRFRGAYKNPDDLPSIYREVHFTWAIDMYEEGLNSSWLLPNRLYEGGLFDAVPIALKPVETGAYLDRLGIGVTLEQSPAAALRNFFQTLTEARYRLMESAAMAVPRRQWRYDKEDCRQLVSYLGNLRKWK